jgi:hypothetical protein
MALWGVRVSAFGGGFTDDRSHLAPLFRSKAYAVAAL